MEPKQIGWEVVGPLKKGGTKIGRLVWQPNERAIRVSYDRLLSEGYSEDDLEVKEVFWDG